MRHATNMQHIHVSPDNKINQETGAFQKMDAEQYKQYITAHIYWRNTCDKIDADLHERALARRYVEQYKEVPLNDGTDDVRKVTIPGYFKAGSGFKEPAQFNVKMVRKKAVEPTKSTKPHQEEKRVNKAAYKSQQTKVKANVWAAKTAVAATKTSEKLSQKFAKVDDLREKRSLNKEFAKGAKDALKISSSVRKIETDSVTNIAGDGEWTVVTRKRGKPVLAGYTDHDNDAHKTSVFVDPGMGQAVTQAAIRKPTKTGAWLNLSEFLFFPLFVT